MTRDEQIEYFRQYVLPKYQMTEKQKLDYSEALHDRKDELLRELKKIDIELSLL